MTPDEAAAEIVRDAERFRYLCRMIVSVGEVPKSWPNQLHDITISEVAYTGDLMREDRQRMIALIDAAIKANQ
jgi:hypothetical protein